METLLLKLIVTPLLIGAALIVIYIILGVLYESIIHPITILSTLPSAGIGALLLLMAVGMDLSVIAIIGIILLIGIVKKNGIMMVDFALEAERNEGKNATDAIYQASLLRFRPILMTTMAALLSGIPLAFGSGIGSELRKPLGVAMVGCSGGSSSPAGMSGMAGMNSPLAITQSNANATAAEAIEPSMASALSSRGTHASTDANPARLRDSATASISAPERSRREPG